MEEIRVYVPKTDQWSNPIVGVSKSFLVEGIVESLTKELDVENDYDYDDFLPIELNHRQLRFGECCEFIKMKSGEYDIKCDCTKLDIPNIETVKVSVGGLKRFVAKLSKHKFNYIVPAVQEIIERADLTSLAVDENYCLIIKFGEK